MIGTLVGEEDRILRNSNYGFAADETLAIIKYHLSLYVTLPVLKLQYKEYVALLSASWRRPKVGAAAMRVASTIAALFPYRPLGLVYRVPIKRFRHCSTRHKCRYTMPLTRHHRGTVFCRARPDRSGADFSEGGHSVTSYCLLELQASYPGR